jgi:hypothetical protein
MKTARAENEFWWKGGDGKKQNEEANGGELEKPLRDFIQDFGEGCWETQTSLIKRVNCMA